MTTGRIILHLDLDCFYCEDLSPSILLCLRYMGGCGCCMQNPKISEAPSDAFGRPFLQKGIPCTGQVEQKRLGIPREVPAAVQQWVRKFSVLKQLILHL